MFQIQYSNAVYQIIKKHEIVQENCRKLVGLEMGASPLEGAHAYFSAAINTGFNKLIVIWSSFQNIAIYDTVVAKNHYDGKTGVIKPCESNENRCIAKDAYWIFCKES